MIRKNELFALSALHVESITWGRVVVDGGRVLRL